MDFILETAEAYLSRAPSRQDVKAVFAGLRPLAAPKEGSTKTKEISRSHKVIVSKSKLVSITGACLGQPNNLQLGVKRGRV